MAASRKFWLFKGLLPDSHAHQIMLMVAGCKGYVETFVPAQTGPEENGVPTSVTATKDFIARYIAENPTFTMKALAKSGVEAGHKKITLQSMIYALKNEGALRHDGPGAFSVVKVKDAAAVEKPRRGRPPHPKKANGAEKPKRASRGKAEGAVITRLNRAQGVPVPVAELKEAVIAAGGSAKSMSGMLARLVKTKKIKHADEKGTYLAA
jgi:hypothetical protein